MRSHFFQQHGFSLIEVLLSVMILSVFLLVTQQIERQVVQHLSHMLNVNLLQLELTQTAEKMLAYPALNLNTDQNRVVDSVALYNHENYREIFLCSKNGRKTCASISVQNLRLDSH